MLGCPAQGARMRSRQLTASLAVAAIAALAAAPAASAKAKDFSFGVCAALDQFSYAEVTVSQQQLQVELLDQNGAPVPTPAISARLARRVLRS